MSMTTVGVLKEHGPGERRVAMVPDVVGRVSALGLDVVVETGAGAEAWWPDSAYTRVGARVLPRHDVVDTADVLLTVDGPDPVTRLRPGQVLIGLLHPHTRASQVEDWRAAGVTAISLDLLPRTLSRAQAMDALTSQSTVAGYKAALLAADTFGSFFPMLTTAAGTVRPAKVLVIGAGVAGLQAIGTARRLGAIVTGHDVRADARADIASLGAACLELPSVAAGEGVGGYARALTADEQRTQQEELGARLPEFDVVISTAQVPGRRPPVLVTAAAVGRMRPGSVIVDLGGTVEGVEMDVSAVLASGVVVIGAGNLPSRMAPAASTAYARTVTALLAHLARDGEIVVDTTDEIQAAIVVTHAGGSV
jgi:proton-translocating NAD(P)+ transhydrogenase subunit alpha